MFPTFIGRIDIQSWWEVPSVAYFSSLLQKSFNLPDFDIEDLEEALLTDGTEEVTTELDTSNRLIPELLVKLLQGVNNSKWDQVTTSNYQMYLRRLFRQKCQEYNIENPFNEDTDFQSLPLRTKLQILHNLCDFCLDFDNIAIKLDAIDVDDLRIEPVGFDENGSAYWYFYGTRLYREDYLSAKQQRIRKRAENSSSNRRSTSSAKKENSSESSDRVWQVICFTEDDWNSLVIKLEKSKNIKERALYDTLKENYLPQLPKLFKEKEAKRRRRLFQPRTSNRIAALAEQQKKYPSSSSKDISDEEESGDISESSRLSRLELFRIEKEKIQAERLASRLKLENDRKLRAERRLLESKSTVFSDYSESDSGSDYSDSGQPTRRYS